MNRSGTDGGVARFARKPLDLAAIKSVCGELVVFS